MRWLTYISALLWMEFEARMAGVDEHLAINRQDFATARQWRSRIRQIEADIRGLRFQYWLARVPL